ncbi:RHTO0S27e01090g1_1 [Rhodotorula toruloides]|uniref:RHTO0S27e01090g1_1 n=1 Tax=Rhodotorula toruloides TaxID=5286 RepID=A0A061BR33_RHOTO|nr:RHTO0S27e01090g1_1 [Rhodotorula toruloides]
MPDAATQTDAWDWQVAQVPRSVLVPTARSDSNEVDEEVSSGRATEPVARRSGPASLLSLPDELLEQIYQELYRQLSIDRKSLSYRRQRLMPSTSSLLVSKRIYDIGRAIWFSDWSDVDGRTRAMLLMHIDNYAPYVKSWSSFVSDAGLDFVLLRRFVNLTSLDLTFEDYVSLSIISNLLPRFGHLVSLRIASVVPDDGYGRMRLADYSLFKYAISPSSSFMRMLLLFPGAQNLVKPLKTLLEQDPHLVFPLIDLSIRFHEVRRNYNAGRTGEILCEVLTLVGRHSRLKRLALPAWLYEALRSVASGALPKPQELEIICRTTHFEEDLSKVVAMVSCFPDAVRLVLSQSRSVDYEYDDYPLDKQDDRVALLLQDLRTTQIVRLSVSNPDGITQWWRTSSQEDFVVQEK